MLHLSLSSILKIVDYHEGRDIYGLIEQFSCTFSPRGSLCDELSSKIGSDLVGFSGTKASLVFTQGC
jgi:hypothetical protein